MKTKITFLMILIVLFTIFVSQNTQIVEINFFFWQYKMSAIVLISLTALLGMILGFIISAFFGKAKTETINDLSQL